MFFAVCLEEPASWKTSRHSQRILPELAETVIAGSKDGYPELEEKKEFILNVISKEEEQFNKTIDQGLGILAEMISDMEKKEEKILNGEDAFRCMTHMDSLSI